jgi:hypothetical protein
MTATAGCCVYTSAHHLYSPVKDLGARARANRRAQCSERHLETMAIVFHNVLIFTKKLEIA